MGGERLEDGTGRATLQRTSAPCGAVRGPKGLPGSIEKLRAPSAHERWVWRRLQIFRRGVRRGVWAEEDCLPSIVRFAELLPT